MRMKLHEPNQLNIQTLEVKCANPWQGPVHVTVWAAYQVIWMKLLTKTNPGEARAFLRSHLKMYMTMFFLLLLWKQSKADS